MRVETLSVEFLTGCDSDVMVTTLGAPVHPCIVAPFCALQSRAAEQGFDLQIISGFRSFDRQCGIWNAKAQGQRPLLDSFGAELDFSALSEQQLLAAILRWSALPGASRHHWGCDVDVYDAAAVENDYQVQLTPEEVSDSGVFGPLHKWLDEQFTAGRGEGFFRPYGEDRGGVAPERWHLSYAPLAAQCQIALRADVLAEKLRKVDDLQLKTLLLDNLPEIFERYINVPMGSYPKLGAGAL
ncbi:MAG: M15 family metallopeptidase [Spongiibacteraceae bacterium]